jgi:hypothetical protein
MSVGCSRSCPRLSALVAGATSFRVGLALGASWVLPHPAYVQMGVRVSEEGGADVPAAWATPRPS